MDYEPIKRLPGDSRKTALPIGRPDIYAWFKQAEASIWTTDEVDLSKDKRDYDKAPKPVQYTVEFVHALFASLDKIVNINVTERFEKEFGIFEVSLFYGLQVHVENVHNLQYSFILDTLVSDPKQKDHLLNSIETMPIIKKIAEYMETKLIASEAKIGDCLVRAAFVEGQLFMSAFCIIYWFQEHDYFRTGLCHANEFIARDESLHTKFSIYLHTQLQEKYKATKAEIHSIAKESTDLAIEFANIAIPDGLIGLNKGQMADYVKCVADNLLTMLGVPSLYNVKNPFHFMEKLNITHRGNFFEKRLSDYSKKQPNPTGEKKDLGGVEYF